MKRFWKQYKLPVQDAYFEVEEINPAEAFRRQADAINSAGPIYAEMEHLEARLYRISTVERELRTRVLAQNIGRIKSTFRSAELIDALILDAAVTFIMPNGQIRDVGENLLKLARRRLELESRLRRLNKRLQALESMADKCDRILNWAKHEARLELGLNT